MNKSNHPYHLVTHSPWPLLTSFNLMIMLIGTIKWMYNFNNYMMLWGLLILLISLYQWWRDVVRESTFQGFHTNKVSNLMKMGMILFIMSEILFFMSFFWSFFHMSLSPSIEIGMMWPPKMILPFNPFEIPLLNTIILLSSGITITSSHYYLLFNKFNKVMMYLFMTILLGIYFTYFQWMEYNEASFTISDSVFGTTFYMITGFHGIHVIIGTIFIIISSIRMMNKHMSSFHHLSFEMSSWYWHFVDVVWLFVYLFIYWWKF